MCCPSHFLSETAFPWDAMLNMTKADLELFTDFDKYLFFERGGVSCLVFLKYIIKPITFI